MFVGAVAFYGQDTPAPTTTPTPLVKNVKPEPTPNLKGGGEKPSTGEQVIETAIVVYALGGGRDRLDQIRKTTNETGKMTVTGADGKKADVSYQKFTIRGSTLDKERIRIDDEFPDARYSLVFADNKVFGIFNNTVFAPRDDVVSSFLDSIYHGVDAMLRYKENGSTVKLAGQEKLLGVEYYLIDVTDTQGRSTRFYVSVKSYRVLMLTYEEGGVKYVKKFYNHNYAQGTLVPYHTVLTADNKVIEDAVINSITFGQKVDEELFRST